MLERLKILRKRKGMTQTKLAELLKIDASEITRYEKGQRSPNIKNLIILAEIFEVSVDYLLGLTPNPNYYKRRRTIPYKTIIQNLEKLSERDVKIVERLTDFLILEKNK